MFARILFFSAVGMVAGSAQAFDYDDCVLSGMKGVSSDVAAHQVRLACKNKLAAHRQKRYDAFTSEYGESLDDGSFESATHFSSEERGYSSMEFTNKSKDKTVKYVRLSVAPAPAGTGTSCDFNKERKYAYTATIKPGAKTKFVFPNSAPLACINAEYVFVKVASWKDISLSSTANPVAKDPLEGIEPNRFEKFK